MASTVYFFNDVKNIRRGTAEIFKTIGESFPEGKVALKVNFGEEKNTTHVRPEWLMDVTKYIKEPVFVDCNVLYRGQRTRKADHIAVAERHGFGFIPIDILDGEMGEKEIEVPVNVGRTKNAKLGGKVADYSQWVAVTHFKGHIATGFGGCLKNVGMGLGSRAGKMDMHSIVSPYVKTKKCVACGTCVADCPVNAITLGEKAAIDSNKCIGCAHCIAVCPQAAFDVSWDMSEDVNRILMERIAEYARAALKGRRWWFMNFVTDVTWDCDCMAKVQTPFMKDVGILLSKDPVACDQAALDLVKGANSGEDPFQKKLGIDGSHQLEYAEKIGLGVRGYALEPL